MRFMLTPRKGRILALRKYHFALFYESPFHTASGKPVLILRVRSEAHKAPQIQESRSDLPQAYPGGTLMTDRFG